MTLTSAPSPELSFISSLPTTSVTIYITSSFASITPSSIPAPTETAAPKLLSETLFEMIFSDVVNGLVGLLILSILAWF
jgi:hypothetical protein